MKYGIARGNSDNIAELIRNDIHYGKLKAGRKVLEKEFVEKYQSSGITVREALRVLEGEGLLIHQSNGSYHVIEINLEGMLEIIDLMRFITIQLLNQAIPRYSDMTYYQLRLITEEMLETTDANKNMELLQQYADTIFFPAGLSFTYSLYKQILNRNLHVLQGLIKSRAKGRIPVIPFNKFIELCQAQKSEHAMRFATEQLDKVAKAIVAYVSEDKKMERS
jgi:DNA-binding GntR family transcriptional regulator